MSGGKQQRNFSAEEWHKDIKKKKKRESLQKSILVKITWKLKKDYSKKSKKEIEKKNSGKTLEEEDNFYKTLFQAMNFGPADKNGR